MDASSVDVVCADQGMGIPGSYAASGMPPMIIQTLSGSALCYEFFELASDVMHSSDENASTSPLALYLQRTAASQIRQFFQIFISTGHFSDEVRDILQSHMATILESFR